MGPLIPPGNAIMTDKIPELGVISAGGVFGILCLHLVDKYRRKKRRNTRPRGGGGMQAF